MTKIRIFYFLLLGALFVFVFNKPTEPDTIVNEESELSHCPQAGGVALVQCIGEQGIPDEEKLDALYIEMARVTTKIEKNINKDWYQPTKAVDKQREAWENYRKERCRLYYYFSSGTSATMHSALCYNSETKKHIEEMKETIKFFKWHLVDEK